MLVIENVLSSSSARNASEFSASPNAPSGQHRMYPSKDFATQVEMENAPVISLQGGPMPGKQASEGKIEVAQEISIEVLLEKYAEPGETSEIGRASCRERV